MNNNHHIKNCQGQVKYTYKGGVFRLTPTIFEELVELGIHVPESDRFYPYFSVFDFECILSKENLPPIPLSLNINPSISLSAALFAQIFPVSDPQPATFPMVILLNWFRK